jgi:thiol-disulfide isomerase/thioredoxin
MIRNNRLSLSNTQSDELFKTEFKTTSGKSIQFDEEIENKLIFLNFIMGTWCPLCMRHLKKIIEYGVSDLNNNPIDIYFISTESHQKLQKEFVLLDNENLKIDHVDFISDQNRLLVNLLGLKIPIFGFSKPASFLFTKGRRIIKVSNGIENTKKEICSLETLQEKVS